MEKAPIFRHLRRKTGQPETSVVSQKWLQVGWWVVFLKKWVVSAKRVSKWNKGLSKRCGQVWNVDLWRVLELRLLRTEIKHLRWFWSNHPNPPRNLEQKSFWRLTPKIFKKIRFHIYIYIVYNPVVFFSAFFSETKNELTIKLSKCRSPMPKM